MTREQAVRNLAAAARWALRYWYDAHKNEAEAVAICIRMRSALADLHRSKRKVKGGSKAACPRCRHRSHRLICYNMDSENGCDCSGSPKRKPARKDRDA